MAPEWRVWRKLPGHAGLPAPTSFHLAHAQPPTLWPPCILPWGLCTSCPHFGMLFSLSLQPSETVTSPLSTLPEFPSLPLPLASSCVHQNVHRSSTFSCLSRFFFFCLNPTLKASYPSTRIWSHLHCSSSTGQWKEHCRCSIRVGYLSDPGQRGSKCIFF